MFMWRLTACWIFTSTRLKSTLTTISMYLPREIIILWKLLQTKIQRIIHKYVPITDHYDKACEIIPPTFWRVLLSVLSVTTVTHVEFRFFFHFHSYSFDYVITTLVVLVRAAEMRRRCTRSKAFKTVSFFSRLNKIQISSDLGMNTLHAGYPLCLCPDGRRHYGTWYYLLVKLIWTRTKRGFPSSQRIRNCEILVLFYLVFFSSAFCE